MRQCVICNSERRISKIVLSVILEVLFFLAPASLYAQHYVPIDKGSRIEFSVTNKETEGTAVKVKGTIGRIAGKITFDPKHPDKSAFDITLDPSTVNTHNTTRDKDLKGFRFFNTAKHPSIHFVSISVTQDRPGSIVYTMTGKLTIKGITLPAKIQFTTTQTGKSYLFRGTMSLSRVAYNVGEKGDISDDVSVFFEVRTK